MSAELHPEQLRAMEYLARKGTQAPAETLRSQLQKAFSGIEELFDSVAVDERAMPPAPGRWSPHEILDHLVLSHGPAVPQFSSLLSGVTPEGVAIPADLHRSDDERGSWEDLRAQLGSIHKEFRELMALAADDVSLEPTAAVEIVVKIDGKPLHWLEQLDWKAFIQAIRVHTLEHHDQLKRTLDAIRA